MSDPGKAVFLSYASQDAEAAKRIAEALRGAGVEVWFDAEGGLEHGDEWDAKIRRQIKECVLFIPIISANTEAREEGYFRIEWDLAAERARGIASGVAFILPVVIDGTREQEALVPDRLRAVQWTKLPGGTVPPEVLQRFLKLWSHRTGALKHAASGTRAAVERPASELDHVADTRVALPMSSRLLWPVVGGVAAVVGFGVFWSLRSRDAVPASVVPMVSATPARPAPVETEARALVARARNLFVERLDTTRDDCALAEDLLRQSQAKDGNDAEVWAALSQLHSYMRVRGWDLTNERREAARAAAQRATRLDPGSFEGRLAEAFLLADTGNEAPEKERVLRELRREQPTDKRVMRALATVLDRRGELTEADALSDEAAALPGGDPLALYNKSLRHWFAGNTAKAEAAAAAALEQAPNFTGALMISAWYATILHGDLERARETINRIAPAEMREDRAAYFAYFIELLARQPDAAIARLQAVPRPWFSDAWYRGPKATLVGDALHAGGRPAAATVERRAGLRQVEEALRETPNSQIYLFQRALLLAKLGEKAVAAAEVKVLLDRIGANQAPDATLPVWATELLVAVGRHEEAMLQISRGLRRERRAVDYTAATLRLDPLFDPLRGRPEFVALISEAEAIEGTAHNAVVPSAGEMSVAKSEDKSVAVLAFANLSGDQANEYFSDGISEELLNVLAKVPGLKVSARTSAFHFKGKDTSIPEIARQLGVAYVVEGSVRKQGDRVRITAQLIKAADGFHVWSDTFTRDLRDIFAVQDEIAGLIATNLKVRLGDGPKAAAAVNPEAYRLVLEGRHFFAHRTMEGFDRAERAFQTALALDPKFALAQSGLAQVTTMRGRYEVLRGAARIEDYAPLALAQTRRAEELDPAQAAPFVTLGTLFLDSWRLAESRVAFERGRAADPSYVTTYHWRSHLSAAEGRLDIAIEEIDQAVALDPLSSIILYIRGFYLADAGRHEEALAAYDRAAALREEPLLSFEGDRARMLLALGRRDEALAVARRVRRIPQLTPDGWTAAGEVVHVLWQCGSPGEAEEAARQLLAVIPAGNYQRGYVLCALGNFAEGLPALAGIPVVYYNKLYWHPMFDPARSVPEFRALLEKLDCEKEYGVARATLARILPKPQ